MTDSSLRLRDVGKRYGEVPAIQALTLDIPAGETFALLGPSGCGKTTTLRLVAGLEVPDTGEIWYHDRLLVSVPRRQFVPPEKRQMGMVFQSYAIWPHMTVFENVAYPLRLRGVRGAALREKVGSALALVGLSEVESRPAPFLSGGQQQRVALARALVYEPEILLLDEPFSNLDPTLREQMREEVKQLQRRLGLTMVFVTHDQVEALSIADRVAVLSRGRVEQVGVPRQLYERPETPFVRDFLGKAVLLDGRLGHATGTVRRITLSSSGVELLCNGDAASMPAPAGTRVLISLRPEDVVVMEGEAARENTIEATVEALLFMGDRTECRLRSGAESLVAYVPRSREMRPGQRVRLHLPPVALRLWPADPR